MDRVCESTVSTFDSLNKCVGSLGIIHDRAPSCLGMDAWMTLKLIVALIRKLRRSLMGLAYCFDMLSTDVVQPSTGRCPVD